MALALFSLEIASAQKTAEASIGLAVGGIGEDRKAVDGHEPRADHEPESVCRAGGVGLASASVASASLASVSVASASLAGIAGIQPFPLVERAHDACKAVAIGDSDRGEAKLGG